MTGASVVTPPGRTSAASNQTVPSRRDQVLHDLLLAVDGDALPGELREVDAVALAVELQVDRVVHGAFGQHAPAHAAVAQQVGRPLLEHAGPHAGLDVGAGAAFDDDAPDPRQMQQVRQHQARRAGADDADLRARAGHHEWVRQCTRVRPAAALTACRSALIWSAQLRSSDR